MLVVVVLFLAGLLAGLIGGYKRKGSIAKGLASGLMMGAGLAILPLVPFGWLVLAVLLVVGGVLLIR